MYVQQGRSWLIYKEKINLGSDIKWHEKRRKEKKGQRGPAK